MIIVIVNSKLIVNKMKMTKKLFKDKKKFIIRYLTITLKMNKVVNKKCKKYSYFL